jgi:hypothetical protein
MGLYGDLLLPALTGASAVALLFFGHTPINLSKATNSFEPSGALRTLSQ